MISRRSPPGWLTRQASENRGRAPDHHRRDRRRPRRCAQRHAHAAGRGGGPRGRRRAGDVPKAMLMVRAHRPRVAILDLSIRTVKTLRAHIQQKLRGTTRARTRALSARAQAHRVLISRIERHGLPRRGRGAVGIRQPCLHRSPPRPRRLRRPTAGAQGDGDRHHRARPRCHRDRRPLVSLVGRGHVTRFSVAWRPLLARGWVEGVTAAITDGRPPRHDAVYGVLIEMVIEVTWRRRITKTVLRRPVSKPPTTQRRWPSAASHRSRDTTRFSRRSCVPTPMSRRPRTNGERVKRVTTRGLNVSCIGGRR